VIVHTSTSNGKVQSIEGNPDHPINRGTLCSKGQALYELANNNRRLRSVLYRAPGSDKWEKKNWDWALREIATRMLKARDKTFKVKDKKGIVVNRTEGLAQLGGAALDNEECYLLAKLARSLGIVFLEHQARI
jgi:formate dehydrogenase major subunit